VTAYYNEIDPFAARWLRNLIKAGHIAPGDVDERSILDVHPTDLTDYDQVHVFAGIGGWSYALRLAGWPDDRPVWTGSAPCQPFSTAGNRAGFDDDRHLWPAFFWHICQCQPSVVFGEQVSGPLGRAWWDVVATDLESAAYACTAFDLPAACAGAFHKRQRLYWVAHTQSARLSRGETAAKPAGSTHAESADTGGSPVAYPTSIGYVGRGSGKKSQRPVESQRPRHANRLDHTLSNGWETGRRSWHNGKHDGQQSDAAGSNDYLAHAQGERERKIPIRQGRQDGDETAHIGRRRRYGDFWFNAEWLLCTDGKARPIEPGSFPLAHGVSGRVGRLRGYGNAIVPQVAARFVKACMECIP
jgi:DNA (cytosine-5)-methyltransferase 1